MRRESIVLPHIVPSFSLVVASIRLGYALCMVSSNGINRGSLSSLFTLPVERLVSAVVEPMLAGAGELPDDGLATTEDTAEVSALGAFGTSATGANVPFGELDFSSMRSAP